MLGGSQAPLSVLPTPSAQPGQHRRAEVGGVIMPLNPSSLHTLAHTQTHTLYTIQGQLEYIIHIK